MFESKYSKVLTVILVIVIVAILGLIGFLGYDYYKKYQISKEASDFVDNYQGGTATGEEGNNTQNNTGATNLNDIANTPISDSNTTSSSTAKKGTYKGFETVGTMEIPAINFNYPVLNDVSAPAIEVSVGVLYPNGENLNQPGNTVIIGHNYRNGVLFSNNKKLKVGDKIYVTDYRGTRLTYTIYNKFETSDQDTSFYQRETNGKAELTLSTCTDASNNRRLIILAKQD